MLLSSQAGSKREGERNPAWTGRAPWEPRGDRRPQTPTLPGEAGRQRERGSGPPARLRPQQGLLRNRSGVSGARELRGLGGNRPKLALPALRVFQAAGTLKPPPQGPGTRPGQEPPGHAGTGSGKGDATRNGLQPSCAAFALTPTGLASRGVHCFPLPSDFSSQPGCATHIHTHPHTPQHLAHRCTHRTGQQLRAHTGIRETLILTPALSVTC